jgi:hypothetical protein
MSSPQGRIKPLRGPYRANLEKLGRSEVVISTQPCDRPARIAYQGLGKINASKQRQIGHESLSAPCKKGNQILHLDFGLRAKTHGHAHPHYQ